MEKEYQSLDRISREAMDLAGLEKAPEGFTLKVMDQIRTESAPKRVSYTPLIRKRGWFILALISLSFLLLLWYASRTDTAGEGMLSKYLPDMNWQKYAGQVLFSIMEEAGKYSIYVLCGLAATLLRVLDRMCSGKLRALIHG